MKQTSENKFSISCALSASHQSIMTVSSSMASFTDTKPKMTGEAKLLELIVSSPMAFPQGSFRTGEKTSNITGSSTCLECSMNSAIISTRMSSKSKLRPQEKNVRKNSVMLWLKLLNPLALYGTLSNLLMNPILTSRKSRSTLTAFTFILILMLSLFLSTILKASLNPFNGFCLTALNGSTLFYSVALDTVKDGDNQPILIGEGYATVAKAYELTGFPCVAAISCYHLVQIGKIIRGKFPKNKIIVLADDDKLTELNRGFNPGIREALKAVKEAKLNGFVVPPFKSHDEGTDWDDFALRYGDDYAAEILHERITWECLSDDEKKEISIRKKLAEAVKVLDTSVDLPPQEFIGGLFPRDFVSVLAAPSGTGKTIFMQKFVSDLSIGGSIFDGFADDEPARKSLIFAGEAGYEMLVRRGASMKWKNNPENIHVVDQYTFETKDIPIMLDDAEGWQNVLRIVDMYKPDIIFIDTFSSFHERDENKATEMKPIIRKLAKLARENHIAVVIVHHSRKRTAKERNLSLNQDDVIGSSILNRLVGLIVGIEPMKDDEKTLLVRPLKTWFSAFMPFTYRLTEDIYGHTRMQTDLAPAAVNNSKIYVWNYLQDTFSKGEWFSMGNIVLSEIKCDISERQLRRILTEFIKSGKLQTRGANRYTEYSLKGFKDKELDE